MNKKQISCFAVSVILLGAFVASYMQPIIAIGLLVTLPVLALAQGLFKKRGLKISLLQMVGTLIAFPIVYALVAIYVLPFANIILWEAWRFLPAAAALALGLLSSASIWFLCKNSKNYHRKMVLHSTSWCLFGIVAIGGLITNLHPWFIEDQMRHAVNPEALSAMPETVNDRILTQLTAREFIQNSSKDNTVEVAMPHLVKFQGNPQLHWQAAQYINMWYGKVFGSVSHVVHVDADKLMMHADVLDGKSAFFLCGDNSWVVKAALIANHPLSGPGRSIYYKKSDGNWVQLISYVSFRPTKWLTMVEYVPGVMEIDQNCWVKNYSLEEAAKLFPGAVFFPTELARKYADVYAKWRGGMQSRFVTGQNILEVSEDPNLDPTMNKMPYIQNFKGLGLQEVIQYEPEGKNNYGFSELLLFDGATGKARNYVVPEHVLLNGARKALENVRKADPSADWSNRRKVEPRLVHGPGGTYWLICVTNKEPDHPDSHAYIMSVLVDARTLEAYRLRKDHEALEIDRFAQEGAPKESK